MYMNESVKNKLPQSFNRFHRIHCKLFKQTFSSNYKKFSQSISTFFFNIFTASHD